jgi:hypothetical protein
MSGGFSKGAAPEPQPRYANAALFPMMGAGPLFSRSRSVGRRHLRNLDL